VTDQGLDHSVYIARPHRLRVIAIIASLALCALAAGIWLLLPTEIRVLFTVSQVLTLLGLLAFLIGAMAALAGSYVPRRRSRSSDPQRTAGTRGAVGTSPQDHSAARRSMGSLLLKPADGRPFEAESGC
jgi:hypothetical protein